MRDKLLQILAGTTAQGWMARADLREKSGVTEQDLDAALEALYASRQINRSKIIRGELEIEAIWITGFVAKTSRSEFTINPKKRPPSRSLTRPEPKAEKEKHMQTAPKATAQQPASKVTTKHIQDLVIARPGIKRDEVYQALVFSDGSNKKKVGDLISALISNKRLNQTDEGGVKRLHPGERLNDVLAGKRSRKPKAESKVKAPAAKLLTCAAARDIQQYGTAKPVAARTQGEADAEETARILCPGAPEYLVCVGFQSFPTLEAARVAAEAMLSHQSSVVIAAPLMVAERTITWKTAA